MNRIITRSLTTAAALGAAVALAQAPASAAAAPPAPSDENGWTQVQDFGSGYLCQAAGMAGQFAGRWLPGQWQCSGPVLWLRGEPLTLPQS